MAFLVRVLINGVAIWLATLILPGLEIVGGDGGWQNVGIILLIALVFGIVNAIVKPIVAILSIPLYILTLGLFTLVVNALMLLLTSAVADSVGLDFHVDGFWTALWGSIVISIASIILEAILPDHDRR